MHQIDLIIKLITLSRELLPSADITENVLQSHVNISAKIVDFLLFELSNEFRVTYVKNKIDKNKLAQE